MNQASLKDRLDLAINAARKAGALILDYYQSSGLKVDLKSDNSPVTTADRGAERLLRDAIAEDFPDDGVMGEELEEKPSSNGYRWILDPLDGTKSFIHGVPLFGTLIGLEYEDRVVLGVCRFPALDEVVYAVEGQGAWWQIGDQEARPAHVSAISNVSEALFCTTDVPDWDTINKRHVFDQMCRETALNRCWGDCYGHILVATGRAEVMIDPLLNAWDAAALLPILEEAGGHFVDWNGNSTIYSGNGLSVNAALKDSVLQILDG